MNVDFSELIVARGGWDCSGYPEVRFHMLMLFIVLEGTPQPPLLVGSLS